MGKKNGDNKTTLFRGQGLRGYTYTLSIIVISATLMGLAVLAADWRAWPDLTDAQLLPGSDSLRFADRAISDYASMARADVRLERDAGGLTAIVRASFPFKKEGLPIADMAEWAQWEQVYMRKKAPYEVIASAGGLGNGSALVSVLQKGGAVNVSNEGAGGVDALGFRHPSVGAPGRIEVDIYCNKYRKSIYNLSGNLTGTALIYNITYNDLNGTPFSNFARAALLDNVSYGVDFDDGTRLSFQSMYSDNWTSTVSMTKSPGAKLVLPFELNVSSVSAGAVKDRSAYGNNLTLGGGNADFAPNYTNICHADGCYRFNGTGQYMDGPSVPFSDGEVVYAESNSALNPDFESFAVAPVCDNGANDNWNIWTEVVNGKPTSQIYFDCTATSLNATYGMKVYYDGSTVLSDERAYQQINAVGNTLYKLSFWTRGDGSASAYYRIMDVTTGRYLQAGGAWGAAEYRFNTAITGTAYQEVEKQFVLPTGSNMIEIAFTPSNVGGGATGNYYIDNVSLADYSTLNSGFEYYTENGAQDIFRGWTVSGDGNFGADATGPRIGGIALQVSKVTLTTSRISSDRLVLKNGTGYALEFWGRVTDGGDGVRNVSYAIYDSGNGLYLNTTGGWQPSATVLTGFAGSAYTKIVRNFRTYGSGVGRVEIWFNVPTETGEVAYIDGVYVTEAPDFSLVFWAKVAPASNASIMSQIYSWNSTDMRGIDIYANNTTTVAYLASDKDINITRMATVADGRWHMIGLAVNRSGNATFYLDGNANGTASFTAGTMNSTANFRIGGGDASFLHGSNYFNGSIDEVRVYSRLLSSAEMMNHYLGNFQDRCTVELRAYYNETAATQEKMNASLNANLAVRIVEPSALLLLPFDVNASVGGERGGAVLDYSQLGLDGTVYNASSLSWTAFGKSGGAYTFQNGGYIRVRSDRLNFGRGSFTISFWAGGLPGANQAVMCKDGGSGTDNGVLIKTEGGNYVYRNGAVSTVIGPESASWHHYALVRNASSQLSIFVDGAYSTTATDSRDLNNTLPFTIGASSATPPSMFLSGGTVDEVRIFNRSLTSAEVTALYRDNLLMKNGTLVFSSD